MYICVELEVFEVCLFVWVLCYCVYKLCYNIFRWVVLVGLVNNV